MRSKSSLFITPNWPSFGQMSALISFSCQRWWPSPSVGPLSSTIWRQSSGLSRQKIQPFSDALRKRVAMSPLPSSAIQSPRTKTPSSSMAVPASSIVITLRSSSV